MNGQETEVKFYVKDLKRIETRLLELKARLTQPRVHEVNYRFDNADGDLRAAGKVLRLRRDGEAKFTFKGPNRTGGDGVVSRKEIEFIVENFDSAKEFLESLGYAPIVFYEKIRATYELNSVQVMLDELPYGEFVEIEGGDAGVIREVSGLLGLNWETMVKVGYHALFERITEKFNLDPGQLSFEALKSLKVSVEDLSVTPAD